MRKFLAIALVFSLFSHVFSADMLEQIKVLKEKAITLDAQMEQQMIEETGSNYSEDNYLTDFITYLEKLVLENPNEFDTNEREYINSIVTDMIKTIDYYKNCNCANFEQVYEIACTKADNIIQNILYLHEGGDYGVIEGEEEIVEVKDERAKIAVVDTWAAPIKKDQALNQRQLLLFSRAKGSR